ncbi:alpha/beta hydrolase [Thermoleophilia bacterium SCSIO 60948]|nr:alpha/beta hydrolase [Thermoleophilia bacterium SCSIO 60948]
MASAGARKLNEVLSGGAKAVEMDLPAQRAAGEHQEDMTSEPAGVRFEAVPDLDGLIATPETTSPAGLVVYLYGGGYVISSPDSRRKTAGHLAAASGASVLVPRYRLAPEHPFPAALDDSLTALRWAAESEHAPGGVVLAGDSSGGGLALAAALRLRDLGLPGAAGILAFSPWADLACGSASLDDNADLSVTKASLLRMAGQYLGAHDPRDPYASPVTADFAGIPPILVFAGGAEGLLDDSLRVGREAARAGADVELRIVAEMQHIFPVYAGLMPEADAAISRAGAWIRERLDSASTGA